MSAQAKGKRKKKQQPATAPVEAKPEEQSAAQSPQGQGGAATLLSTDDGQQMGAEVVGGAGGDFRLSDGGGPGASTANFPLDWFSAWLEWQGISPEIAAEARRELGSPLSASAQQLQSLMRLIEAIDRLKIDPSKAANVSLEGLVQQANDWAKKLGGGISIGLKVPVGMQQGDIERYNMELETLKTNLAGLLAARQAMLNTQMEQLVPHLRLVEALTQSPGYVHPETVPGSIVSGQSPLKVQWISLGGIPNPEAVRDDPDTWQMRPGLGVDAVYHHALPRLDLPPLQLPTEFPKPPKPSEVSVNLSKKEPSGGSSKSPFTWNVFDIESANTKTFNPTSEEKQRLLDILSDRTGKVAGLREGFREAWEGVSASVSTALSQAPFTQAVQLATIGRDAGIKLAEDVLSAVMRQIPVYGNWEDAEKAARQGKLRHGSVLYIGGERPQWFFVEESRDGRGGRQIKFHSFERIADPTWISGTSSNTYNALAAAWKNLSNIIGAAVSSNPGIVQRYAQIMGLPREQSNAALLLIPHLAIGLLNDAGRGGLASGLYGGDVNKLWNNVIHRVVREKLQKSAQQRGTPQKSSWNIGW